MIKWSRSRKEEAEYTDRHFVQKTSGMSNEQLKGFAVVGMTGEWWAEDNSQELNEAGQNNSSLALETTSVATSEWELFLTDKFPFVFYKIPSKYWVTGSQVHFPRILKSILKFVYIIFYPYLVSI